MLWFRLPRQNIDSSWVINAFRRAVPGIKMFNTRLIEIVAVALHQFGVLLHQLQLRMHQGDIEYMVN